MSRKVYVNVTFRLIINMDEGTELATVMDELDYTIESNQYDDTVSIEDTEMIEYEVTDSK